MGHRCSNSRQMVKSLDKTNMINVENYREKNNSELKNYRDIVMNQLFCKNY